MFKEYEKLLHSENYVTKRQSLKVKLHSRSPVGFCQSLMNLPHEHVSVRPSVCLQLLGELLLDRHNFTVMTKYISKPENLKLMMNLLRDNSRNIQFEAFHVFKVRPLPLTVPSIPTFSVEATSDFHPKGFCCKPKQNSARIGHTAEEPD